MGFKLAAHQVAAMYMMDMCEDLMIAYDLGCGKTMIALAWIRDALKDGRISNALIIAPASLIGSWGSAIEGVTKFDGFDESDVELLKANVFVTSYNKTYFSKSVKVGARTRKVISLRPEVDKRWDVVFADEAHSLGGHSSTQTKSCITIAQNSKRRYGLSATPLHGGKGTVDYAKMYGEFQFLTGGRRWRNWTDFCRQLVVSYNMWHVPVKFDEDACAEIFAERTIVCRREDCIDLPGLTETTIPCDLVKKEMYKDIQKGKLDKYGMDIEVSGLQYLKLLQICSGSCKRDPEDKTPMVFETSKDDALKDILQGTDEKVIIFCNYTASIDRCYKLCKALGRDPVIFDGRSKGETWREFQEGSRDTVIAQYRSGSEGLNLQAGSVCIYFEPTLSSLALEQSSGRVYRQGQTKKCTYYYLTTTGTMEDRIWTTVRSGKDVSNKQLNEWGQIPL